MIVVRAPVEAAPIIFLRPRHFRFGVKLRPNHPRHALT
jgi:hypothetical protein